MPRIGQRIIQVMEDENNSNSGSDRCFRNNNK